MFRILFLAHRYVGIAVGLIVTLWCLSGFVMMYVQYPELTRADRVAGLAPLDLRSCCRTPDHFGDVAGDRFAVEMLDGRPVLRVLSGRRQQVLDLAEGAVLGDVGASAARAIASDAARNFGLDGQPAPRGLIERDQWTVYASYHPHRPLHHFAMEDAAGTEFYVSSTTGEVVQMTTRDVRFWNWIGAVVHWLYPTLLRQHTALWLQVVIWLTIVSLFLTVIGVYIGIRQYRFRRASAARGRSPYRGWGLWHHYAGLVFGLFTLTWLVSGLFSVNPWGALEGRSFADEARRLGGMELDYDSIREYVRSLDGEAVPAGTVRLEGSAVGGALSIVATDADGNRRRLGPAGRATPLAERYLADAATRLRPDAAVHDAGWITTGDAYYYTHHEARHFPAYRIRYADGERFYLDSVSGELAFAVDRERRVLRWVFHALHRGDFAALVRGRPVWDLMMWPLLLGVTAAALTGTWMGARRVVRWVRRPRWRTANLPSASRSQVAMTAVRDEPPTEQGDSRRFGAP